MDRKQVVAGLAVVAAVVEGLAPGVVPYGLLPLLLVLLGLVFAPLTVDVAEAGATRLLIVALAAGAAASAGVLGHIPAVGEQLNAILGQYTIVLYGGAVGVIAMKVVNSLKG